MPSFPVHYYHFHEINSTQTFLREHPSCPLPIICRAETQTGGYGQHGRTWQSPLGQIYVSYRFPTTLPLASLSGLTQAIALALLETIDPKAQYLQVKWPNDLFLNGKKCAGILVETAGLQDHHHIIIGTGINVTRYDGADEAITFLQDVFDLERETLYPKLIQAVLSCVRQWENRPYLPANHRWQDYDRFHNQWVHLDNVSEKMQILGIDQNGRLMAKDSNEHLHFFSHTRIQHHVSTH